jgi:hypothetical protein
LGTTVRRKIRDQRRYHEQGYSTFEEYCQKRWNWSRRYVNYQIQAAEVVRSLGTTVPTLRSERQVRELVRLTPQHQLIVAERINFTTATEFENRTGVGFG